MHYVDQGSGDPIVFCHGNPSWSFMYRELIRGLAGEYIRCIAPDHIGFGLSDKPYDWSYLPRDHAANLHTLLNHLELDNLTLVVHDWGGPIGLSYALANPQRVKRLIILNTFMWSLANVPLMMKMFSKILGGRIGKYLSEQHNLFANQIMKRAASDPLRFPPHIHAHYLDALPTPSSHKGSWVFPRELLGSTE